MSQYFQNYSVKRCGKWMPPPPITVLEFRVPPSEWQTRTRHPYLGIGEISEHLFDQTQSDVRSNEDLR